MDNYQITFKSGKEYTGWKAWAFVQAVFWGHGMFFICLGIFIVKMGWI
jgi:hypothetical protein